MNVSYAGKLDNSPETQSYEQIRMNIFDLVRLQIENFEVHESAKCERMQLRDGIVVKLQRLQSVESIESISVDFRDVVHR